MQMIQFRIQKVNSSVGIRCAPSDKETGYQRRESGLAFDLARELIV